QCFPIAFGIRQPKVAVHLLLHVPALLCSEDQHLDTMKTCHATNHGGIVGIAPISMDFAEISKYFFYVIQEVGPLRMSRKFGFDTGFAVRYLLAQQGNPISKIVD